MKRRTRAARQRGFTLVEMIVTLVILAILSTVAGRFILTTSESYVVTAARSQLAGSGRILVDRIAFELRNALPNSVRTTAADGNGNQCLEFIPIRAATTYVDPAFRPEAFKAAFSVVDFIPPQDGAAGVYAVIYPASAPDLYGAAFSGDSTGAIVDVTVGASAGGMVTLTSAHGHRFSLRSPVRRLFLTDAPVSYCVTGGRVYRYQGYGFSSAQCTPATCLPATTQDGRHLVADEVDNSGLQAFDFMPASRRRNSVVQLAFNFERGGDAVLINHEVLIQNAL